MKIENSSSDMFYVFENGDGTKYTVTTVRAEYGGLYVICNESSLWRFHSNPNELKFLCGHNNKYTQLAILQLAEVMGWVD